MELKLPPYSYRADTSVPSFDDSGYRTVMDAQCSVCARGARWIARNDETNSFKIILLQSDLGVALMKHYGLDEMIGMGWKNADGTQSPEVAAIFKNTEQGGATAVWCATSPNLDGLGGLYCEDCDVAPLADENSQRYHHARAWIGNVESADRLWRMTKKMIDA